MYFIPLYNLGNNNLKNLQKIQTSLEISVPFNSQFYISALKLTFPDSITIVDLRNFSFKCFVLVSSIQVEGFLFIAFIKIFVFRSPLGCL